YLHDALWCLWHYPGKYFDEMIRSTGCYFGSYKDQETALSIRLGRWNDFYDYLLLPASLTWWPRQQRCDTASLTLLLALPLASGLTMIRFLRAPSWNASEITKAFMLMTITYTSAMAIMFEIGENPRFRSVVDPLFLVLLARVLGDLLARLPHSRGSEA